MILVCGASGELGSRIVRGLRAEGSQVRALVRPQADTRSLRDLDLEFAEGDFRDPGSLRRAVVGVTTVISTVTVIGRALGGEKTADFKAVDIAGHRELIAAAEAAGAARFLFVSATRMRRKPLAGTPLGAAKVATEDRLLGSTLRPIVVRPDQYQEIWLSPVSQFDWQARKVVIFGRGETPARYVATDDVARAVVRLALADDPPKTIEFGGPAALTANQAADIFERAVGEPIRRRHVPRAAMRLGVIGMRRWRPALASVMGGALAADLYPATWDDRPLRELGIEPTSVEQYAEAVTQPA